jgi:hypothetical protein
LSDDILKIVNDLKLSCETYLFECANNRPVACDSLQTSLERERSRCLSNITTI